MVASRFIVLAAAASVSASTLNEDNLFASLLKRQEPGTPAYNCHDNCGTAITLFKAGGDVCSNNAFKSNYVNCLACAGPDNVNIWRYYGNTLSTVGSGCGLETTPKSGKQPDVPPAQHGESSPSSAEPGPSTAAPTSEASTPPSEAPAPTGETAPTSGVPAEQTSAHVKSPVGTPTATDAIITPSGSGFPIPGANETAGFTAGPPQQTANTATNLDFSNAALFGVIAMGMLYGLRH